MALTAGQVEAYQRDGFLVLEGFVPAETCDRLRGRMAELLADFDPAGLSSVFETRERRHGQDSYFLESGDKVRFFLEPGALDEAGELRQAK